MKYFDQFYSSDIRSLFGHEIELVKILHRPLESGISTWDYTPTAHCYLLFVLFAFLFVLFVFSFVHICVFIYVFL